MLMSEEKEAMLTLDNEGFFYLVTSNVLHLRPGKAVSNLSSPGKI